MTAVAVETGQVTSTRLGDGLLVQLAGDLGADVLPEMRQALLGPLPEDCRDVVVDAGEVDGIDVFALAVVFASWAWTEEHGGRFLLSRTSAAFDQALADNGAADDLPRLTQLPRAPQAPELALVPLQRMATV